jgi:cell division protein FtsI (penicillin-binding protein 3)
VNIAKDIRFRVYIAFTFICVLGVAIVFKALMIQVKEGKALRDSAQQKHTRNIGLPAERGNIYSEDGLLLSSSIPQFDVHIDFSVIDSELFAENIDSLSYGLAALFNDKTQDEYKEQLTRAHDAGQRYYSLADDLTYTQYEQVRSLPIFREGKGDGGFIAESHVKRVNPYDMLAYRTIGLFRDNSPNIGLEANYNKYLKGENGSRVEQKMAGNTWVPVEGFDIEPKNGNDIVTTIDIGIQNIAEYSLKDVLQKYECKYGTCVVMEVQTGKVRAMVNLGRQPDGSYWEDYNYALIPTEPGSTFKLATLISLLNDKYISVDNIVDAEGGSIRFGDRVMRDSHFGIYKVPIWSAFAQSSNAAMAKLAHTYYRNDPKRFVRHLDDLRLSQPTGIDLEGERKPYISRPGNAGWGSTSLPWMATGYGVQISPMHTCMLYNAIANNGVMMRPYLVSAINEYGKNIKTFSPQVLVPHVADAEAIAQLKRCLRAVVTEGTAKGIESPYYTIAGKTGTAQVFDKGIAYEDNVYQGSFVGYFPAESPKYTICVVIRTKPHSDAYYGAQLAAPVFRLIADKIFAEKIGVWDAPLDTFSRANTHMIPSLTATLKDYRKLLGATHIPFLPLLTPPGLMTKLISDSSRKTVLRSEPIVEELVPDVTGMSLKDAVYLLESSGLQVQIVGKGKISGQSVPPGSKIVKGENIILQLS